MAVILLMPLSGAANFTKTTPTAPIETPKSYDDGFTNITVHEAYEMLTCTCDGVQIPIDVRTVEEWKEKRIDTPAPENPVNWPDLQHGVGLEEFMEEYADKEIVLYCRSGNRSFIATLLLIDNGFTGTIYQMVGGIKDWEAEGYPIKKARSRTMLHPVLQSFLEQFPNAFPLFRYLLRL